MDLNHRPPDPEEGGRKHLSAASGVAYGTFRPFALLLNWTEIGLTCQLVLSQLSGIPYKGLGDRRADYCSQHARMILKCRLRDTSNPAAEAR